MKVVVFLGPSCPLDQAKEVIDADFLPPARRGDVALVAHQQVDMIVLIDGMMVYDYCPSPMEVFRAIEGGITVLGSASLGALRAVELETFGMVGSGWVFDQYKTGEIESDDEVVSLLHPETFAPLTVPLVRIRYGLSRLVESGAVTQEQRAKVIADLRATYYEARSKEEIRRACERYGLSSRTVEYLFCDEADIKRIDARACLSQAAMIANSKRLVR